MGAMILHEHCATMYKVYSINLFESFQHSKVLKPACIEALKRIFNLCDGDKDKVLNDDELNEFQVYLELR